VPRVCIGSTNPVKIRATEWAFQQFFAHVRVRAVEVSSHVPAQPTGKTVWQGAHNRARAALARGGMDYGVGLEGGLLSLHRATYNGACCVIINRTGTLHTGFSPLFELPPNVLRQLRQGQELGAVMDQLTGQRDIKRREGAIGVLSRNVLTREEVLRSSVVCALLPFVNRGRFGW
jgi:inosine/xanthosine triphosphatase